MLSYCWCENRKSRVSLWCHDWVFTQLTSQLLVIQFKGFLTKNVHLPNKNKALVRIQDPELIKLYHNYKKSIDICYLCYDNRWLSWNILKNKPKNKP